MRNVDGPAATLKDEELQPAMPRALIILLLLLALPSGSLRSQEWESYRVRRGDTLTDIAAARGVAISDLRNWNELRGDRILVGQTLRILQPEHDAHVVRSGDTLIGIARRHDVPVSQLRALNGLRGDVIRPGQTLKLRPSPTDQAVHVVRRGDILSRIAERHGLTVDALMRINGLDGDRIYPGQKLRLKEAATGVILVERGDALWEIARAYGITVDELKRINGLDSDRIYPGQELRLGGEGEPRRAEYRVRPGDNLIAIARLHQMSLRELKELNDLRGSVIHPGQTLHVRPLLGAGGSVEDPTTTARPIDWTALRVDLPGVKKVAAANGPYYYAAPRGGRQKHRTYIEESRTRPKATYARANKLWRSFEAAVEAQGQESRRLEGWHVVLDPGHGGIDPGAIVEAEDDAGESFFIVEDEYVYDLALRVYVLLKRHGADVTLTLLSPNHLLRGNEPVNSTFEHERNEVFNDAAWNRRDAPSCWPKSGQRYFDERVNIAKAAWRGVPRQRQIFLSFHADNDVRVGDAVTLFYFHNQSRSDTVSREFARRMLSAIGAGARVRGKGLGVLRNNPAPYKLLVEARNLADHDHIWSIRYEQLRQRDAEKIVQGLLDATRPES